MMPPAPASAPFPDIRLRLGRTWFAPGDCVVPVLVVRNASEAALPLRTQAHPGDLVQPDSVETILPLALDEKAVPPFGRLSVRISLPLVLMQALAASTR